MQNSAYVISLVLVGSEMFITYRYYIILCIFFSNNDSKVMTDLDRLPSSCVIFCKAAQLAQISESACVRALIMRSAKRQFVGRWLVFFLTLFRACFLLIVL
jgi:hypothetical protein